MTTPLLRVEDLVVEFGPKSAPIRVLEKVNFEMMSGSSIGIVGESGSGKSMTSLAIMRLIPEPAGRVSGRIEFDGRNLLDLPKKEMPRIRGRDIAMIFQEPMSSLNPVMSIGDQIAEGIMLHESMPREKRREKAAELLRLVGMPDPMGRLDSFPHQFSGGMRQRVMIAMAIACNPRLLIADEPTTALDVTIQAQVLQLMKQVRKRLNSSILIISHDLGVIADIAEHVIVMYAGRVIETGDSRSIFRNPTHPYTRGLLDSVPRLKDDRKRLHQIPGSVPLAGMIRQGCPFYARCGLRMDKCQQQMPPMQSVNSTHNAACWVTAPPLDTPRLVVAGEMR
ncbi:ABC transporter ATP-binding protein [Pelagibacterium lentulum]|uniref:ABC transporter ATP-binding protein n=1 Tax=Pelagibacterium lentulum TaxID=2029865 RepID=A0A916VUR1_9HYPH|nr:ABC transporter ATP-binding protein [Pelagibacterium lentulum]GGA40315.1 ABC transporter ATP-binding protein [Pelagibacterium lentulum]